MQSDYEFRKNVLKKDSSLVLFTNNNNIKIKSNCTCKIRPK